MKTASFLQRSRGLCVAVALGAVIFLPATHAQNAPRIDALHVAKLASDYLSTHGKAAPYVTSIVLEKDALFNGKTSWVVRWSHPLFADGNKEVGMRVRLDGAVSYLVDEKGAPKKRGAPQKAE